MANTNLSQSPRLWNSLKFNKQTILSISLAMGIFTIYTLTKLSSFTLSPKFGLRRRNAVSRPKRRGFQNSFQSPNRTPNAGPQLPQCAFVSLEGEFIYIDRTIVRITANLFPYTPYVLSWNRYILSQRSDIRRIMMRQRGENDISEEVMSLVYRMYLAALGTAYAYERWLWDWTHDEIDYSLRRYASQLDLTNDQTEALLRDSHRNLDMAVRHAQRHLEGRNRSELLGSTNLVPPTNTNPSDTLQLIDVTGNSSHGESRIIEDLDEYALTDDEESIGVIGRHFWSNQTNDSNNDAKEFKELLYFIAVDQARNEGQVHWGISCNSCNVKPIRGTRWRCANCSDYDLCSDCEMTNRHIKTHIFYKIKIPAPFFGHTRRGQPVTYPGRPEILSPDVPKPLKKKLLKLTLYDNKDIDALYDLFSCLANLAIEDDINGIGGAIDRDAFNRALLPATPGHYPRPSLIFDRIYHFFDINQDGIIDFEEFVLSVGCLHAKLKYGNKFRRVFQGFDFDGDGFVSRREFMRMFLAYYTIQKELTRDLITQQEIDHGLAAAMRTILSTNPLSSIFTASSIDSYEQVHSLGSKLESNSAIFEDSLNWADQDTIEVTSRINQSRQWNSRTFYDQQRGRCLSRSQLRIYRATEDAWQKQGLLIGNSQNNSSKTFLPRLFKVKRESKRTNACLSPNVAYEEVDYESTDTSSSSDSDNLWCGYKVPERELDLGRDIMYQLVRQGVNELLDPLFLEKELNLVQVRISKQARNKWKMEIDQFNQAREQCLIESLIYAQALLHVDSNLLSIEDTLESLYQNNRDTLNFNEWNTQKYASHPSVKPLINPHIGTKKSGNNELSCNDDTADDLLCDTNLSQYGGPSSSSLHENSHPPNNHMKNYARRVKYNSKLRIEQNKSQASSGICEPLPLRYIRWLADLELMETKDMKHLPSLDAAYITTMEFERFMLDIGCAGGFMEGWLDIGGL